MPPTQRRTLGGSASAPSSATASKTAPTARAATKQPARTMTASTTRRTAAAPASKPGVKTASKSASPTTAATRRNAPAPKRTIGGGAGARPTTAGAKSSSPQRAGLGSLYGPSPTRSTRSKLEQLADEDENNNDNGDRQETSIGRHSDLDDMSPETASFKELIEIREKQHNRVKDVLVRYNDDLQKRLDTASAVGSLQRYHDAVSPGSAANNNTSGADGSSQNQKSAASPSTRSRALTVGPVSTADEAKLIAELLNEDNTAEKTQTGEGEGDNNNTHKQGEGQEGEGETTGEEAVKNAESKTEGTSSSPDTPRTGAAASAGGVSRTALRAIVKHAQDTVNKAIDDDRERQAEFEETVLGRMQSMERMLGALQNAIREQHENRVAQEEEDKTVRESRVKPLEEQMCKMEDENTAKQAADKEQFQTLQSQIEFVSTDLQALARNIQEHQQDLDEKTRAHADELTKKAVDDASDKVRDLCEAVERGLTLTERVRDDIPQAIVTSVENVEASLQQAMQSEFEAQTARIQNAEDEQEKVNKENKEMLDEEVRKMKEVTGETLGDLRREYDGAITEHIEEVRVKAEEYEEARRAALPVPDTDRVKLMQEELESSLQMLKYLTEASSSAMSSTIPPRLERSEQKSAELEATLESQQQELNRIRHADLRFDVAVGPDNLKDAWLGVSSYRAPPPPVTHNADGTTNTDEEGGAPVIGFDENGNPIEQYSPETMHEVHNQISEALRLIARRHASMSPLRGSPRHNNTNNSSSLGGADAGATAGVATATSTSSSPNSSRRTVPSQQQQNPKLYSISAGGASCDSLPEEFDNMSPRDQLESLNLVASSKRAQLVTVQKVLSNIQHAFHELTTQEAEVMSQSSPSRLAPTGGTPRTVAEYQHNRKICDEIASRKSRMYEKERQVVEKRNKLTREIDALQERESEVFRALSSNSGRK